MPWATSANSLPQAIQEHSAVVWNGYIYTTGGANSAFVTTSTVYYAPVNADGTVGAWQTSANSLPQEIRFHSAVAWNGYIYTTGGLNSGGVATSTVYFANINADGTVGT